MVILPQGWGLTFQCISLLAVENGKQPQDLYSNEPKPITALNYVNVNNSGGLHVDGNLTITIVSHHNDDDKYCWRS